MSRTAPQPTLEILRPGMMMTVQDGGRHGLLRFGVSSAGPMDAEAMAVANALVGNTPDAAALEFAAFGGALRLSEDRIVAVCGDVAELRAGGRRLAPWQGHLLRAGEELVIGAMRATLWGYLALSGGIATPPELGARATHLRTRLGGLEGRALRPGDRLPLASVPDAAPAGRRLHRPWRARLGPIRVVPGPQEDAFSAEIRARFYGAPFAPSVKRDRMALLLDGPDLPAEAGHDIVSDGTLPGSIQVPGSGHATVLMAERQTTGGYPKIATVASVDLARLAQMPTHRRFRFQAIGADAAEALLLARSTALAGVLEELAADPGAPA